MRQALEFLTSSRLDLKTTVSNLQVPFWLSFCIDAYDTYKPSASKDSFGLKTLKWCLAIVRMQGDGVLENKVIESKSLQYTITVYSEPFFIRTLKRSFFAAKAKTLNFLPHVPCSGCIPRGAASPYSTRYPQGTKPLSRRPVWQVASFSSVRCRARTFLAFGAMGCHRAANYSRLGPG